ncbi:hypothetical protein KKA00_10285 [bacterium]|nr:hypothetical protein [bacterium]MBU1652598.1 hypothetical protein [bacterium]
MKARILILLVVLASLIRNAIAYPPAVGILGDAENCLVCHVSNGPWGNEEAIIIDIIDRDTKGSLKQADGSFLIEAKRGETKTVLTVIGRSKSDTEEAPYRNAWLYLDPETSSASLSKFAPGWDVNLPMACRIVGDKIDVYEDARITVLPMSIRPNDAAQESELVLQVMLTKGEAVKGKPKEGITGNYFERKVCLIVK